MGTKMAVAFSNISMAKVETDLKSKRFNTSGNDSFTTSSLLWHTTREEITEFI